MPRETPDSRFPRRPLMGGLVLLALLGLSLITAPAARAQPAVVASILPLQSLVASVTEGVTEVEVLIPAGQSPHGFALRPSDVRRITRADLVVWIGPRMEQGLSHTIARLRRERMLVFEGNPDIHWLTAREGGEFEPHAHEHGHHHDHGHWDMHIWLSPANAGVIVAAVAERLAAIDPDNADAYARNADNALERLSALDARLQERLEPVRDRPFVVFHDAYQYLEAAYGLNVVGAVSVGADHAPGVRRVATLRERIRALGAVCVFSEPQFPPRLVETLIEGSDVRSGELDPIGSGLAPGPDAYFMLMENLADDLRACLGPDDSESD